jgi:hypothetical protein
MLIQANLTCHPACVCPQIDSLQGQLTVVAPDRWQLRFSLEGAVGDLLIPDAMSPERVDDLWRHTCFEAFVGSSRTGAYYEFNFSPSGEWAAYQFDSYRTGMKSAVVDAPRIACTSSDARLDLEVDLRLPLKLADGTEHAVSLTAVIEDRSSAMSYWAVKHVSRKPDFHQPGSLVLRLPSGQDGIVRGLPEDLR